MKILPIIGFLLLSCVVSGQVDTTMTPDQNYYRLKNDFQTLESKVYTYADLQYKAHILELSGAIFATTSFLLYDSNTIDKAAPFLILSGVAMSLAGYVLDWISVTKLRNYDYGTRY